MKKALLHNGFSLFIVFLLVCGFLSVLDVWQIKPAYASGTFGLTTVGSSYDEAPSNYIIATKATLTTAATITTITYFADQVGQYIKCALYSDNAGSPNTLLASSDNYTATGNAWTDCVLTFSYSASAGDYWFAIMSNNTMKWHYNSGSDCRAHASVTWPALPDPFGSSTLVGEQISMYATYTVGLPTAITVGATASIAGQSSIFYSYWMPSGTTANMSYSIFSSNNTGPIVNDTAVPFSAVSGNQWANYTKTLNSTAGTVQWQIYANDTDGNNSTSSWQYLTTTEPSPLWSTISLIGQKAGVATHLNIQWTAFSGTTLDTSILCWNNTGPFTNTSLSLSGSPAWHNFTGTANSTAGNVIVAWFYANNTVNQWTTTNNVTFVTYSDTMALHTVGTQLQDDTNMTIILRGVDYTYFIDGPLGSWLTIGGSVNWNSWDPTSLNNTLDAMKTWGSNCIRVLATTQWWTQNNQSFISNLETFITCARDRGLYVDFTFWRNNATGGQAAIPYSDAGNNIINNTADFVDLWGNVSQELRVYSNILFELWNEPSGNVAAETTWFSTTQNCLTRIRSLSSNIFTCQWGNGIGVDFAGYATYNGGGGRTSDSISVLDWIEDNPLNDTINNILYSTHFYRANFYDSGQGYISIGNVAWVNKTTNDLYWAFNITGLLPDSPWYPAKPLWIGEIGCSGWAGDQTQEQNWFSSSLTILNSKSIGYCAWAGPPYPNQWNLVTGAANYAPSTAGTLLIAAMGIFPPYVTITSPSNTTYTSSTISVSFTASGGTVDQLWYNCKNASSWIYVSNQTYTTPTTMTGFVNGSSYTFYAWANNTLGDEGEATIMFTVIVYTVEVTIITPASTTYTSSSIPVEFSAVGGTIDQYWYNCKNASSWIYGSNQTYTVPTSMTGYINGSSYTFYAWANNTLGDEGEATIAFTVTIYVVDVTITSPTASTYTSSSITVTFSADGGTIDRKWFNCKNASAWIYVSNQTYTTSTSMTGFVNGSSYTFYAWANNTLGESDEETVAFIVLIYTVEVTVTNPTATTYTTSYYSVEFSAVGGTIDVKWWNVKNGSTWVYASNNTYTVPASPTGFTDGSYTFYAFANNTLGNEGYTTVAFTVTIEATHESNPQTSSSQTVLFKVTLDGKPLQNCQIRIVTTTYQDYISTYMTDEQGEATAYLQVGTYDYHATYQQKAISGTFQHIEEETIKLDLGTDEATQTPGIPALDRTQITRIGIGLIVVIGAVFAITTVAKKKRW